MPYPAAPAMASRIKSPTMIARQAVTNAAKIKKIGSSFTGASPVPSVSRLLRDGDAVKRRPPMPTRFANLSNKRARAGDANNPNPFKPSQTLAQRVS
jgi:hypothetical protein